MIFRQIVFYALLIGVIAGSVVTVAQTAQVVPIIAAAEAYEEAEQPSIAPFKEGGHSHVVAVDEGQSEWMPADGVERTAFTLLANVLTAMGFSLLLLSAMVAVSRLRQDGAQRVDWRYGLLWGVAGYAVFWLAPALGLPPEIPLVSAAPLAERQWWWLFAMVCTAAGLAGLAFGRSPWRWTMALLLLLPHFVGAPHHEGVLFPDQPPEAAAALESLAQQFIGATAIVNGLLWIVIGLAGAWALRRIEIPGDKDKDRASSVI